MHVMCWYLLHSPSYSLAVLTVKMENEGLSILSFYFHINYSVVEKNAVMRLGHLSSTCEGAPIICRVFLAFNCASADHLKLSQCYVSPFVLLLLLLLLHRYCIVVCY